MTKLTTILLAGVATLAFTACGGGGSSDGGSTTPPPSNTEPPTETPTPPVASSPFDTVQEIYDGEQLTSVGVYIGTGVNYYDLTIPSDGNLIINKSFTGNGSTESVKLYDRNLNLIEYGFHNGEPFSIEAGDYILSFDYNAGGTITLNSNTLYNQNTLPLISSGTYTGKDVKYYTLAIPSDGNLIINKSFTGNGSTESVKLYDRNLNLIEYGFHNGEPFSIEAGDYILSFDYNAGGTITLKSS